MDHIPAKAYPGLGVSEFMAGSCQNYGPFLGPLNIRCRIIIGTQKGTIILTITHMRLEALSPYLNFPALLGRLSARRAVSALT